MHTYDLIYSNQTRHRLARHCILWVLYAVYFTIQSYYPIGVRETISLPFVKMALFSTAVFLPFCLLSTYVLLYYLYPRFLIKGRIGRFFVNLLALIITGVIINYAASTLFVKYNSGWSGGMNKRMFLGVHNVAIGIINSAFLLGIKMARDAYLQQKVILELARQKSRAELQLLKTRIDPQFLFHSLHTLQEKIDAGSPDSSRTILELSDLLSDILYENDKENEQHNTDHL